MLGFITGIGLAGAAGLNAYVPLIIVGLLARFTSIVELPAAWAWLTDEWLLGGLALLLVIEVVADKIPAVDSINDIIQTVVRPSAGGVVFGAGSSAQTFAVHTPSDFFATERWLPIAVGMGIALGVHLLKAAVRPLINIVTFGLGGMVVSVLEDAASFAMALFALIVPILTLIAFIGGLVLAIRVLRRARRRAALRRQAPSGAASPPGLTWPPDQFRR